MFQTINQWFLIIINHDEPSLPHTIHVWVTTNQPNIYGPQSRIAAPQKRPKKTWDHWDDPQHSAKARLRALWVAPRYQGWLILSSSNQHQIIKKSTS